MTVKIITPGMELPPRELGPISRTTLALFAGASGDHNPIHLDIDVARSSGYEDVFAHGMLSMAYLGRLVTSWVPQARLRSFSVRFAAITPIHARPTCTGKVVAVDAGMARLELTVHLDDAGITLVGDAVVALD